MNYPDYYLKACNILRCKPESSFEAKKTRFHRMVERWQLECYHCMGNQGQQPQLSEGRLEELQWAIAVIYESERSLEPRPQPSTWVDRLWQDLPWGQLIPDFSLGEDFASWISPVFVNGIMYSGYQDFCIGAVDITAKEGIWRFTADGRITSPVMDQGLLVFGSTGKHAYALDASTGREIWRFRATAQIRFPPAVKDGAVYISAGRTQIHCLDILSGRRKWSVRTDTPIIGGPFSFGDAVLQHDRRRRLNCYGANTGEFRWTARTAYPNAHHLIQADGIFVMPQKPWWSLHPSYYDGKEKDGCRILDFDTEDRVAGEETDSLVAFQIMTGSLAWVLPMPGSIGRLSSSDGIIYGTCHRADETAIFAIEGETGRELWMIGLKPLDYGRVLAHDGRIYYADDDGNMYSVSRP